MAPGGKYRKKNMGDHDPSECNHTIQGKFIHYKPTNAMDGKNMIHLNEGKGTRHMIIPCREPLEIPVILPASDFQRLKKQAYVVTEEEKKQTMKEAEERKQHLINESIARKGMMAKMQQEQNAKKGSLLDEVESDASKKNKYLLERAYELQQEQEDEIKNLNGVILASKCLAIREAQIAEKKLIKKELEDEDKRLDIMMEQQRQIGLRDEKLKREQEEKRNQEFVRTIKQQLRENEIQELIDAEKKAEEMRIMQQQRLAMAQEEAEKQRQKLEFGKKVQDDLKRNNEDLERYRALQREEERIADMRYKSYLRKKQEQEEKMEADLKGAQLAKEKEIQRLREVHQKAADIQSQRDMQNAFRLHEEAEREWRRKEKLAAIKKKEQDEALRNARAKQIDDIRRAQALEIERDEQEFHKLAKAQYDLFQIEQQKVKDRQQKAMRYRKAILQQVNEKERERIENRKIKIEEGHALRLEQEIRDMKVKETLEKKIEGLRRNNVPEQTIADIQRKINMKLAKNKPK